MTTDWEDFKREHPLDEQGQAEYDRLSLAFAIGEQVKELRHKLGWSQQDLARQMGTTQPVIARLETGGSPPSREPFLGPWGAVGADLRALGEPEPDTGTLGGVIPSHFRVRTPGLRAAREARGLSRAQLALMAATTPAELAAIEEGVQTATDEALRHRLMRALDADWDELFEVVAIDRFGRSSSPPRNR